MTKYSVVVPILVLWGGICGLLYSQTSTESVRDQISELRSQLRAVRESLDSLKSVKTQVSALSEEDLRRLEDRLEEQFGNLEKKIDAVARASGPIVFNPRTTAFLNVAARIDNKVVHDETGETEIDDRPFLRGVELDLRAPVDPYAEAVAILAVEDEAGQGFAIDPEEVYGLIKRIPLIETAPLGVKWKVGKFRAPFGSNNRLHLHDLPWTTRPLVVSKFLGTEHGDFFEGGFSPIGSDFDFFLPNPFPWATLEMNLDVLKAGDLGLSGGRSGKQPALLAHVNFAADWNNEHILVLGASGYRETGTTSTRLGGFDVTYKWSPPERRSSSSIVLGGEAFFGSYSFLDSTDTRITNVPRGWFAYLQYQASYWLYLGARYDWIEEPSDVNLRTSSVGFYASYYTTEFLRFRLGLERRKSDHAEHNNLTTMLFEINFVFGSHPTEPYWVNR